MEFDSFGFFIGLMVEAVYILVALVALCSDPHNVSKKACDDGILFQGSPTVCCARSCGACDRERCSSRPGGYSRCCERGIVDNQKLCEWKGP